MKSPADFGFRENPFSQQGVPPNIFVPFSAYPNTFFHELSLREWLSSSYLEKRPGCYILVGDYGSGKSHAKNIIKYLGDEIGYDILEEAFDTTSSLYSTIYKTNFKENRTLILFDEVQALYEKLYRNEFLLNEFKAQLRNFLEGKKGSVVEKGFENITLILCCTPQVKNIILAEEDMSQRFMLTVRPLPNLDPFIGLNITKNLLQSYADSSILSTKLSLNPYYPLDRYLILTLINLTPYIVEKLGALREGAIYSPTSRFLILLLRHCFDYLLNSDLEELKVQHIQDILKDTMILENSYNLSPSTHKIVDIATSPEGEIIATFLGSALGWWTTLDISRACNISPSEVENILQNEFSSILNVEKCWIVKYQDVFIIKDNIKKLGRRYEDKLEDLFSVPWIDNNDDPCYLLIPSLHLLDDSIEKIFRRFLVRQDNVYWLKNSVEIFNVSLEGKLKKFSHEQIEKLREFLSLDSLKRDQSMFNKFKEIISYLESNEDRNNILYDFNYGDNSQKIIGMKIIPHVSSKDIFYRCGIKFLSVPNSGIIDSDFRSTIEWLKSSYNDFIILFLYPDIVNYTRLSNYLDEEVKFAPANKRIFIKMLNESDVAMILTNIEEYSQSIDSLILKSIRNFNKNMLDVNLLLPLYGLKWSQHRLNPNSDRNIFNKLRNKWFLQSYNSINNDIVKNFIKSYYINYYEYDVTFEDGENIDELFNKNNELIISHYENIIYNIILNQRNIDPNVLKTEINKCFIIGALYKLKQANIEIYDFIVEILLGMKNLIKLDVDFVSSTKRKSILKLKNINEEKQHIFDYITQTEENISQKYVIKFFDIEYKFNNKKYVEDVMGVLKVISKYIKNIKDSKNIIKQAYNLSNLYYINESINAYTSYNVQMLYDKSYVDRLTNFNLLVNRIKGITSEIENVESQIIDRLEKMKIEEIPKNCITIERHIKKYIKEIISSIKKGKGIEIIENEIKELEKLANDFIIKAYNIILILDNFNDELFDYKRTIKDIIDYKSELTSIKKTYFKKDMNKYIKNIKNFEEKSLFLNIIKYFDDINLLVIRKKIRKNKRQQFLNSFKRKLFKQIIEDYDKNIKKVITIVSNIYDKIYNEYTIEFQKNTEGSINKLYDFWNKKTLSKSKILYQSKIANNPKERIEYLFKFYKLLLETLNFEGLYISNAIAFNYLDTIIFENNFNNYSRKLGLTKQSFTEGINILEKNKILNKGYG